MFCRRFIKCNDSSEFHVYSCPSQNKPQLQRAELVRSCQASTEKNPARFFFRSPGSPAVGSVKPPQSQNPLNSSLKQVSLCRPGVCFTHAIMSCSSLIPRQQKQFQQMVSRQDKGETQKPHRQ